LNNFPVNPVARLDLSKVFLAVPADPAPLPLHLHLQRDLIAPPFSREIPGLVWSYVAEPISRSALPQREHCHGLSGPIPDAHFNLVSLRSGKIRH
jgi:hypothetical protein